MYSFNFPEMVGSSTARLLKDKEAVKSNFLLLMSSQQGSLFGDPYFGVNLKKAFFEQSGSMIVDLLIDEIYTAIITFIPQVFVTRKDITIYADKTDIYASIHYMFIEDKTSDMYVIKLTETDN